MLWDRSLHSLGLYGRFLSASAAHSLPFTAASISTMSANGLSFGSIVVSAGHHVYVLLYLRVLLDVLASLLPRLAAVQKTVFRNNVLSLKSSEERSVYDCFNCRALWEAKAAARDW
eukprot:GHVU01142846.1.p4 GENE.GHVU01142846.1~~GHVU01142846.1.p4  ORF type:complete len:116 (+),score=6.19 GHVU01142846.1:1663-2010(+)